MRLSTLRTTAVMTPVLLLLLLLLLSTDVRTCAPDDLNMTGTTADEEESARGSTRARIEPLMLMMTGPNTSPLLRRSANAARLRGL